MKIIYHNNQSCCDGPSSPCQEIYRGVIRAGLFRHNSGIRIVETSDDNALLLELEKPDQVRGILAHLGCGGEMLVPKTLAQIGARDVPMVVYAKANSWAYYDRMHSRGKYIEKGTLLPRDLPALAAEHFGIPAQNHNYA